MITCKAAEKPRISVAAKAVSASISIGACVDKMSIKLRCLYLPLNSGVQLITRYARFAAGAEESLRGSLRRFVHLYSTTGRPATVRRGLTCVVPGSLSRFS